MKDISRNGLPRSNVKKYKRAKGETNGNVLREEISGQDVPGEDVVRRQDIEADRKLIERILQVGERMDDTLRTN